MSNILNNSLSVMLPVGSFRPMASVAFIPAISSLDCDLGIWGNLPSIN